MKRVIPQDRILPTTLLDAWFKSFYDGLSDEEAGFFDLIKPVVVQAVNACLQAVSDLDSLTVGFTISDSLIRYEDRWQFKDGSPSSAVLACRFDRRRTDGGERDSNGSRRRCRRKCG